MAGRMLLSHNYNLLDAAVPPLERSQFAQVFVDGFAARDGISAMAIDHPHWCVEVKFDGDDAVAVGQACAEVLLAVRRSQRDDDTLPYDTLVLGGIKTTPATSVSPTALQTGDWGVDIAETGEAASFLNAINWMALTAMKPEEQVFQIEAIRGELK
ncbi:MAG: DUF2656 family protein [Cyanophyceae cyanobacterium]